MPHPTRVSKWFWPNRLAAPSLTKSSAGELDPKLHQTKKGNQWYFGIKARIGLDAVSGRVPAVTAAAADVEQIVDLLQVMEDQVCKDAGWRKNGLRPCQSNKGS